MSGAVSVQLRKFQSREYREGMDGELSGGNMNAVRRVGDTVTRVAGPWTPTIHGYLQHLADAGIDGIPRPLGVECDREILSFVEGDVPEYPLPEWVWTDAALVEAATILRRLHDASAGFDETDAIWQESGHEPIEVICHNDFAPHNLAFRDGHVVGVIDFDLASPGSRLWDLSLLATRIIPLTTEQHAGAAGEDDWDHRIRLLLDSYGSDLSIADVIRASVVRLRDEAEFSRRKAAELGKPELLDHSALYDRDATYLTTRIAPA